MTLRRILLLVVSYTKCFTGCLYQVYDVSKTYFSYDSKTTVSITIVTTMLVPRLSTCWSLEGEMDFKGLYYDHWIAILNSKEESFNLFDTMTVRQIFNFTPSTDSVIGGNNPIRANFWIRVRSKSEKIRNLIYTPRFQNTCAKTQNLPYYTLLNWHIMLENRKSIDILPIVRVWRREIAKIFGNFLGLSDFLNSDKSEKNIWSESDPESESGRSTNRRVLCSVAYDLNLPIA